MNRCIRSIVLWGALLTSIPFSLPAQEETSKEILTLAAIKNESVRRAVKQCERSVIRLDLFTNKSNAPSVGTGVLIGGNGFLVTSSYFVQGDSRVIANIDDQKIPTKIIGKDNSRNICLLQLTEPANAQYLDLSKEISLKTGETVIAVGRALSPKATNVSVGIISAGNRIRGKALQTDAKISPTNYGGPLINLKGEVAGIITAISPVGNSPTGGLEWYDSGIGFSIPSSDVIASVERMKTLGDIYPGILGIRFRTTNDFRSPLVVSHCFPRSPAHQAGIRTNDLVTHANNQSVTNLNEFKNKTGRFYAGQSIELQVSRNNEVKTFKLEFAKELTQYRFPYLGLIVKSKDNTGGISVVQVDKHGPLKGIVKPGDLLLELNKTGIQNKEELRSVLAQVEAGQKISAKASRNGSPFDFNLTPDEFSEELQPDSFEWKKKQAGFDIDRTPIRFTGFGNQCYLLSPKESNNTVNNLVLVLGISKNEKSPEVRNFERFAQSGNTAVLVVYPESILGWKLEETEAIRQAIQKAEALVPNAESTTIIARSLSGLIACQLIQLDRDKISGVAFFRPPADMAWPIPMSDPGNPLHTLVLPDRLTMRNGLALAQSIKGNGIPVRMLSAETDFGKLVDVLSEWIWLSRRF